MQNGLKSFLHAIFSKTGFHVTQWPKFNGSTKFRIEEFQYSAVEPRANYAPWFGDPDFQRIYSRIKGNTMVDIYRCYEIWELVEEVNKLDKTASLIEIGVWRGGTSGIIATKLSMLNSRSPFYVADTFTGVAKTSDKDKFYTGGEHADTNLEIVDSLLKSIYDKYKILQGIFPEDTAHLIPASEKFGFCHIDVDVYESAKGIVDWIWDKLIPGGVIVFDDYGFHTCNGVTRYVNEQKELADRTVIHNLNGHAIMIKIK
jgi:O-methyltransferase